MSTHNIPISGTTGIYNYNSDSSASPNTLVERDASGNSSFATCSATTLQTTGGIIINSVAKSAGFTFDGLETHLVCDTTSGSITIALPVAASSTGKRITVKKIVAANSLILDGNASEVIDGATTKTATAQWAVMTIWCDGTAWFVENSLQTWS